MSERHILSGGDGTMECRGDLLSRVLSGLATETDRLAFGTHVQNCESCRMSRDMRVDFERIGAAPDDSVTLARLTANVMASRRQARITASRPTAPGFTQTAPIFTPTAPGFTQIALFTQKKKAGLVARFALAALALGSVAVAGTFIAPLMDDSDSRGKDTSDQTADNVSALGASSKGASSYGNEISPADSLSPQPVDAPDSPSSGSPSSDLPAPVSLSEAFRERSMAQAGERTTGKSQSVASGSLKASTSASAAALFREANQARRKGDRTTAIQQYQRLQKLFPSASEATLSQVSLGGVLLESGAAAGALTQFDRYLSSGSQASLRAEALYGRGRALRALGRTNDEIQNWQRLLDSYPKSPYGEEARTRLAALR